MTSKDLKNKKRDYKILNDTVRFALIAVLLVLIGCFVNSFRHSPKDAKSGLDLVQNLEVAEKIEVNIGDKNINFYLFEVDCCKYIFTYFNGDFKHAGSCDNPKCRLKR